MFGRWACPRCQGRLTPGRGLLRCEGCASRFPVRAGLADFGADAALGSNTRRQRAEWDAMSEQYSSVLARIPPARFRQIDRPLLALARGDVLEVGCGDGRLLRQVAALPGVRSAFGVDVAPGMARRAVARGLDVVVAPAERLPVADGSVDVLLSGYYAMRYTELDAALAEAARVLRRGGRLGFTLLGRHAAALRGRAAGARLLWRDATRWAGAATMFGSVDLTMPNDVRSADELRVQLARHGMRLERLLGTPNLPLVSDALLAAGVVPPYLRGDGAARWGYDVVVIGRRA